MWATTPAAGGLRADGLESSRGGLVSEQARAIAKTTGLDEQAILVDQAVLHERPDDCRAPMDLELVADLFHSARSRVVDTTHLGRRSAGLPAGRPGSALRITHQVSDGRSP